MKKILAMCIIMIMLVGCGQSATSQSGSGEQETSSVDPVSDAFYSATKIEPSEATITASGSYLQIEYDINKTPYDYTDYVSIALSDYIKTASGVFTNTDYDTLRMDMLSDGQAVTSLIMTKDNYNKYNWDDIAYTKGIYTDIVGDFDKFYVESMLMQGVDTDGIEYHNSGLR